MRVDHRWAGSVAVFWITGCMALIQSRELVWADDPPPPPRADETVEETPRTRFPQRQPADDELLPLEPLVGPTAESIARRQSLAWMMTGQLYESRRDIERAVDAYQRSVESDPTALMPYQKLLPLLLLRGETEAARELALQAARQAPGGLQVVRSLGAVLNRQGRNREAISLFQVALENAQVASNPLLTVLLHRDLGLLFHSGGDQAQAAEHLRVVLEALTQPADHRLNDSDLREILGENPVMIYEVIGQVLLAVRDAEGAVRAFEESAKLAPDGAASHGYNLALVFQQQGQPERALQELTKYLNAQLQGRGRAPYQLLAELLAELDRSAELLPWLERLAEADPHNAELQYFLARQYQITGDLDRAEEIYRRVLAGSNAPQGVIGLIPIHRQKQQSAELLSALVIGFSSGLKVESEDDLDSFPPDFRYLAEQFNEELQALIEDEAALSSLMAHGRSLEASDPPTIEFAQAFVLAQLAVQATRTEDVKHFYHLAIDMRNDPEPILYRELGTYLIDQAEYPAAIEVLEEALQHSSRELLAARWQFLYFLSFAYELDHQTEPALRTLKEAREIQPGIPLLKYQEGWIYYHARRWDEAREVFEQFILEYEEDDSVARQVMNCRFNLSNIYVQTGDFDRGEAILLEILKQDPDNTQANNDLGYLWADRNMNLDQAREMITKALAADPENPAYLDSMGWVLYRLEEYEQALDYLERAARHPRGEDGVILEHLGDCYDKLGREDDARETWRKALEQVKQDRSPDEELRQRLQEKLGE